jgi:hypothetical protein
MIMIIAGQQYNTVHLQSVHAVTLGKQRTLKQLQHAIVTGHCPVC